MDRGHMKWALCVYGRKAAPQGGRTAANLNGMEIDFFGSVFIVRINMRQDTM